MIIVGAGGLAKEVTDVCIELNIRNLIFYDDINIIKRLFLNKYEVINNLNQAIKHEIKEFHVAVGGSNNRKNLIDKFEAEGYELKSIISKKAIIGNFDVLIGAGASVLANAVIASGVEIGKGCLIYHNAQITHDCKIGNYVEISPGAVLLGNSTVGNSTKIGANATVLPKINIGSNVIVGAGSVVTKDVPDNCIVLGVPAKMK